MSRKKDTITLSIPPGTKDQLEAIARELKILWGKEPSISGLIVAIANQEVAIGQQFTLDKLHVHSLERAIKLLVDTGSLGDARILVELLLAKATLTPEHRQTLFQHVSQPGEGWRIEIDRYREQKQSFRLLYQNPQSDNPEDYTVRYAEIAFHEKRFFVDAWCEEIPDSPDYPELMHNRCFRLDRIQAILPISGEWRVGLDSILVQLHFYKGLVKAYEFRSGIDEREEYEGDTLRRVWRKVSNPFWLLREVRAYGADCEIVAPAIVRAQAKKAAELMLANYDRSP
jgi:hypothetical protein